jgi:hypothetical protein
MTPSNLALLHQGEEALRAQSLSIITSQPDLFAHLTMIERCMDLIHVLLPDTSVRDDDQLTVGNLGIRVFNALASSLKLSLSGYYQAAAAHLRDILETTFLLDYFTTDLILITRWRTLPERERKNAFKPVTVRTALDKRDGFTSRKRAEAYDVLSRLAGHATPEGFVMLTPQPGGTNVHCGPFLEPTALLAVLAEAAKVSLQAAGAFRVLIASRTLDQYQASVDFMDAEADWMEMFLGAGPDRTRIADIRLVLAAARAEEEAREPPASA